MDTPPYACQFRKVERQMHDAFPFYAFDGQWTFGIAMSRAAFAPDQLFVRGLSFLTPFMQRASRYFEYIADRLLFQAQSSVFADEQFCL